MHELTISDIEKIVVRATADVAEWRAERAAQKSEADGVGLNDAVELTLSDFEEWEAARAARAKADFEDWRDKQNAEAGVTAPAGVEP